MWLVQVQVQVSKPDSIYQKKGGASFDESLEIYKAPSVPRPFKTSRLVGEYEKPWLEDRYYSKRERADKYILGGSALIGVAITFYFCYTSWMSLTTYDVCNLAINTH